MRKEKRLKKEKRNVITIGISTLLASIVFSGTVFATDLELQVTQDYEKWNTLSIEEKSNTMLPKTFSTEIPEKILESTNKEHNVPKMVSALLEGRKRSLEEVGVTYSDARYNLADVLDIRVENQGNTNECWAFSMLKSLETNIALHKGTKVLENFSERHMDYATSRTFLDGINEKGFNREVGEGGLPVEALAYLTNGQGSVLENQMPFENNEEKIYLSAIDKPVDTVVTDYTILPTLAKEFQRDENGNTISVTYSDGKGNIYSSEQVEQIRNIIKQHIVNDGAVSSMTVGSAANSYNYDKGNQNLFQATAYNCNDTTKQRDHAITIVGWDDNYSRDHFAEGSKPSTDGAYIVLNSYGANAFENGYLYVSYEDFLVESELYVITNSKKIDYDGIYQSDFYGGIFSVNTPSSEGYIANIFNRDTSKEEILNTVGVTVPDYGAVEVYINTEGDLNLNALTKIGESNGMLEPGFHMIDVTPTELTTDTFAIVIKQKSLNNTFCFAIEAPVAGTAYEVVNSNQNSYILIDEKGWVNLIDTGIQGIDLSKSDVCIKAFTTSHQESKDEHIAVKNYKIDEQYIVKIPNHTTIKEFKEHIIADLEQNIYDKDVLITEEEALIKTGMKLQLSDGTEYTLIIRGDTNCDGEVTLTDLSKLVLHYNETEGFILEGAAEKAGDMNTDKKITLTDVSQLIVLYNAM